jgi:hypothetical protein
MGSDRTAKGLTTMAAQIDNHERTWTAQDQAIFVEIFVEDFHDLITNYVPAAKRKAASVAFAEKATTVVKDYYETLESPPPTAFVEWLHAQGTPPECIRHEGTVILVPRERWLSRRRGRKLIARG